MSGILNIAVGGLTNAASRIANAASNIVNASSTQVSSKNSAPKGDLASDVIDAKIAQNDYAANAAVIKIAQKNEKALLDIKT